MIDPAEEADGIQLHGGRHNNPQIWENGSEKNAEAIFLLLLLTNSEFAVQSTISVALYVTSTSDSIVKVKFFFSVSY